MIIDEKEIFRDTLWRSFLYDIIYFAQMPALMSHAGLYSASRASIVPGIYEFWLHAHLAEIIRFAGHKLRTSSSRRYCFARLSCQMITYIMKFKCSCMSMDYDGAMRYDSASHTYALYAFRFISQDDENFISNIDY